VIKFEFILDDLDAENLIYPVCEAKTPGIHAGDETSLTNS
jgi:hypothetical protein